MNTLVGLVVFSVALGLVVFPAAVAAAVGERIDRPTGSRATTAVRGVGLLGAIAGFALVVW